MFLACLTIFVKICLVILLIGFGTTTITGLLIILTPDQHLNQKSISELAISVTLLPIILALIFQGSRVLQWLLP